jgi:hypothetical protein
MTRGLGRCLTAPHFAFGGEIEVQSKFFFEVSVAPRPPN